MAENYQSDKTLGLDLTDSTMVEGPAIQDGIYVGFNLGFHR
jgi:hypothetical protein